MIRRSTSRRRRRRRPDPWVPLVDEDGYRGPARLEVADTPLEVEVHLAGHLEPVDGRFHWYGRVTRDAALTAAKAAGATAVTVHVPGGEPVAGRLAEHDAWGNLRVTGTGSPPYALVPVEVELPASRGQTPG